MPYDELKTACHKAFLMPENLAVEKTHKYWAYNTGNKRKAVSYMVILCILIFPFAVLSELMKMNK